MSEKPCLVLYASNHGHTRKIASRIAQRLRDAQVAVVVTDVVDGVSIDLADYGLVVIGGSVHAGHHQRPLVSWMRQRAEALNARPTAVFSVSLTQSDAGDEGQETAKGYLDALLADSGVRPTRSVRFAGALQYREYNVAIRWIMRRIARKQGLPTDTSHDVDLTDWDDVDRFAEAIGDLVLVAGRVT
ncbi:Protoporphyrinogen IX oxidase oxygen-independent HemG [Patulibacter medicamentivorans]|uniref:Protoporphyrinogen IX oxidase oxygen-independent HemG n=1 Tax=Patulibacter medicamentivorans TaxID=1097667 RepID=H0E185_9ACTN|nr:flavodoxin domain-containing protein [Patulibacter medicamentivorans]EHN12524.1 Protoporphyrinogen IX oxidase oxygen-independent HemG [Patulibacter medicamentivorans]